jgi:hypothetical protein
LKEGGVKDGGGAVKVGSWMHIRSRVINLQAFEVEKRRPLGVSLHRLGRL